MILYEKLEALRALAKEATKGPWIVSGVRQKFPTAGQAHAVGPDGDAVALVFYDPKCHSQHYTDARYIAAANPEAIIQLIEAFEQEVEDAYQRGVDAEREAADSRRE